MRTRMVPFKGQVTRMRRILRQTASDVGKRVDLKVSGEESEIDRRVLERIMAPLEHMLRNAVAHGIETPDERRQSDKPQTGTVEIDFGREGAEIAIVVKDDGRGIDVQAVKSKAIERGLMSEDAQLSDHDIIQFILETGFSTAQEVSQVAGRGVGMDVVNNEIKQLGGNLIIDTNPGQGTTFTIYLPLTLATGRALMVQVADEMYAIPLIGIENIVRVPHEDLENLLKTPQAQYQWQGESYQFMHLGTVLNINQPMLPGEGRKAPILLARSGDQRVALLVDHLLGSREIVVKSVGPQLSTVRGVTGATIMADGRIALILDLSVLAREAIAAGELLSQQAEEESVEHETPLVMVVDDSITVRKVTQRLLQRHNYRVTSAKDGVDAIAELQETKPDVMLLDVEMPRMDGFELAEHMRSDDALNQIPIIMITSRTGEKHRERALNIGVNRYMGKPYQEHELLAAIEELTQQSTTTA